MRLLSPRIRLAVEQGDEIAEYVIQAFHRDQVAYTLAAHRNGWPTDLSVSSPLWLSFLAWHVLKNEQPDTTPARFEDFEKRILACEAVNKDGEPLRKEDAENFPTVDPTIPARSAG